MNNIASMIKNKIQWVDLIQEETGKVEDTVIDTM